MLILKIGALAKCTKTSVPTIRYYEEIGILRQARRNDAGQRRYGADDISRLSFVRRCREFGFAIEEVRRLVAAAHDDERPCTEARDLALKNLASVRARIAALQTLATELAELVRQCDPTCAAGCGADCLMLAQLASPSRVASCRELVGQEAIGAREIS
jgi:DNA-binding transcriptional MerR regulator